MASNNGTATVNFPVSAQAAEYVSSTVITDSVPNPNIKELGAWTQRTLPVNAQWTVVAYGNGTFVAAALNSTIAATSPDGITWTQRTLPVSGFWYSVTYGNGGFVSVANSTSTAVTSPDGISWTQQTLPVSADWQLVTYGNGTFVALDNSTTIAATSPDGITWTQRTLPVAENLLSFTYGDGMFVAVGQDTPAFTSPDGITWTLRDMPVNSLWYSVTYGNGKFVAVSASLDTVAATASVIQNVRTETVVNTLVTPAKPVVGTNIATVTITGQTGLLVTDNIDAWIMGSDSTADHNAYEHKLKPFKPVITNVVAGVGFDIMCISDKRLDGDFKVRWAWAT